MADMANNIPIGHGSAEPHADYTMQFSNLSIRQILHQFRDFIVNPHATGDYDSTEDFANYLIYTLYLRANVFVVSHQRILHRVQDRDVIMCNHDVSIYGENPFTTPSLFDQPLYYLNTGVQKYNYELDFTEINVVLTSEHIKIYQTMMLDLIPFWVFEYNNIRYAVYCQPAPRNDCVSFVDHANKIKSKIIPLPRVITVTITDPDLTDHLPIIQHIHQYYKVHPALIMLTDIDPA